jgi:hypothetical protein
MVHTVGHNTYLFGSTVVISGVAYCSVRVPGGSRECEGAPPDGAQMTASQNGKRLAKT